MSSKDLFNPSEYSGKEEEVVGVHTGLHSSGIELEEGINTSMSRNYCSNCKKKIHCFVKIDKETKEAIIHNTCRIKECECKCRTHYACRNCGYLHPYGEKCNRPESETPLNPQHEEEFEKLMDSWREGENNNG